MKFLRSVDPDYKVRFWVLKFVKIGSVVELEIKSEVYKNTAHISTYLKFSPVILMMTYYLWCRMIYLDLGRYLNSFLNDKFLFLYLVRVKDLVTTTTSMGRTTL